MVQDRKQDEGHVRALDEERIAALTCDIASLERRWSEEFTVNTKQPGGGGWTGRPRHVHAIWNHRPRHKH